VKNGGGCRCLWEGLDMLYALNTVCLHENYVPIVEITLLLSTIYAMVFATIAIVALHVLEKGERENQSRQHGLKVDIRKNPLVKNAGLNLSSMSRATCFTLMVI
jgi:hypothetical protein